MSVKYRVAAIIMVAAAAAIGSGCGLFYDAGSRIKTDRIRDSLKPGETALQVHHQWGEPDLRKDIGPNEEIWSYASSPNTNDLTAKLFYTSTKPGDESKFLDLKFVNGALVSWNDAVHTMPAKQGAGFSYGLGPGGTASPLIKY